MEWTAYLTNSLTINVTSVYSSFVTIYTNKGQSLSTFFCSHKLPAPITNNTSTDFKPTPESPPKKSVCFPIYLFISTKAMSLTQTPTMKWKINGVISSQRRCKTTQTFIKKVTRLHKRETMISLLIYIQNIYLYLKDLAIKENLRGQCILQCCYQQQWHTCCNHVTTELCGQLAAVWNVQWCHLDLPHLSTFTVVQ